MINKNDIILVSDKIFQLLKCEKNIFTPEYFGVSPIWSDDENFSYHCIYELVEYQLYLKSFTVSSDGRYPAVNGIVPEYIPSEDMKEKVIYNNIMETMNYTGSIVIGTQFINNYSKNNEMPCYGYKIVKELVFSEGNLTTTIDHSKAMLRIRRNLELGLKSLDKKRDVKCIEHFINSSFAGDYDMPKKREHILIKRLSSRK